MLDLKLFLHKRTFKQQLSQHQPKEQLVLIKSVHSTIKNKFLGLLEEDEFEINGNMYDVVYKKKSGDSIIYYCVLDNDENLLINAINTLIEKNFGCENPFNEKQKKNLLKLFESKYLVNSDNLKFLTNSVEILFCSFHANIVQTTQIILSPPPEMN